LIRFLVILLSVLIPTYSYSEPLDFREVLDEKKVEFLRFKYDPQDLETLEQVYSRFVIDSYKYSNEDPMVSKTKAYNQQVQNWERIKKEESFKLYVDVEKLDLDKLLGHNKDLKEKAIKMIEELKKRRKKQSKLRGSVFYMASKGTFDQENSSGIINFEQNSSFSLGGSVSFYTDNPKISYSSSFYYSHLNAAKSNLFVKEVSVDAEIGGNIYGEYKLKSPRISLYTGLDFEKFNTFNVEGLASGSVNFDSNKVVYLTFGTGKSFTLFKKKFFSKLSFSKSLISSRSIGFANAVNREEFKGNKVLVYLFKSINKNFFFHSLFKYHWMSGPSDMKVKRLGIGFGYIF